ncbi:long-chain-fatty-acid--CoA ligase [Microbacterium sediminis]|uniref:long-chain-fatty-acid--CoA ligase n=1 Tax=Microbacterium sediminis TaxID=904291 RepID=UPI000C160318|nr:long-chain fatty acid--CoA ligase [Microbacterium sediminis]
MDARAPTPRRGPRAREGGAVSASNPWETRPWTAQYAPGVPADIGEVTESLVDMMERSVRTCRRKPALVFFGATIDYRELGERIARAAGGLRRLGVRKGDRVALVLPNCPQHVIAFYAVLSLGAIVVEHNPLYTPRELRHQFEDHEADVAIVWDKTADAVAGLPSDARPTHIVAVDLTDEMPFRTRLALRLPIKRARESRAKLTGRPAARGLIPWRRLLGARPLPRRHPRPAVDDVALLQYTSGTTGDPKGVILTHRNLRANAMQGRAWVPGLREGRETFYGVLPLFHAYGLTLCLTFAMSMGATLVLFPTFDAGLVADAAKKDPPTFLPAVPPIYDALARAAGQGVIDLSTIRFAISGAMSLPLATVRRWEEATGGLLVEGYGMTETSPVALGNPMGPTRRPGTVGVPFPGTDIRVTSPDDPSVDVPAGERGELLLRGPQVFAGYWRRPEATAESLLPGGWVRTGDIVTVAEDGFVTVVDRIKELIITGGYNVAPHEVEETLEAHPDVDAAAVVGLRRPDGSEQVAAAVQLREGRTFDAGALRDYARTHLADYKVPRRIVQMDELPRSLVGKVLRREVRERMAAGEGRRP